MDDQVAQKHVFELLFTNLTIGNNHCYGKMDVNNPQIALSSFKSYFLWDQSITVIKKPDVNPQKTLSSFKSCFLWDQSITVIKKPDVNPQKSFDIFQKLFPLI